MRDRSLVRAILTTALRFRVTIGKLLGRRLEKPLPPNATALSHILHVAAAQILFLDIPDSAAVDLAVTHAKSDPRTTRFSGLVNGVLRSLARAKDAELAPMLDETADAPHWFAERLVAAYGEDKAKRIMAAHRVEAPVDFTVKSDPEVWAERLGGIVLPTGTVRVGKLAGNVTELPGFAEGHWWVQDAAASLPARLFGDIAGQRVADLCAAPGGKTAQLILAGAEVTAIDASKNRLARLGAKSRAARPSGKARRRPTFSTSSRKNSSTPCCSTRPARPPARSGAIPTCRGRNRLPTSKSLQHFRQGCSPRRYGW